MKKVLKFILVVALLVAALALVTACNSDEDEITTPEVEVTPEPTPEPEPEEEVEPEPEPEEEYEEEVVETVDASHIRVALVAHSPESILDDHSFNAGAWDGINQFLTYHGLTLASNAFFFQPPSGDDEARLDQIYEAVAAGFNVLVLPGFHFVNSLYDAQDMFPDVHFILLDASPGRDGVTRIEANVAAMHYAEHEAGFLAGYAAVQDGLRSLGFMGGVPVPAVVRYAHGFIQGAEHAAAQLGLEEGEITVNVHYLFSFAPAPEHAVAASGWFADGVEVIFAAAGGAGNSVMSGAEASDALVIGVDTDQSGLSDTVITSAMKALNVSVVDMLTDILHGNFRGGIEHWYDASINGVGLPMANSQFSNFTQAQYDAIFAQLASGAISVNDSLELEDILEGLSLVTVNEM